MAFDASVIGSIADNAPNIPESIKRGYELKDIVDQNQMHKLQLSAEKQKQSDDLKARDILKGADYTNPKSLTETASKLTQAGLGDKAMQLMKTGQQYQSGEIDLQIQKLQLAETQQGAIVSAIDPIVQQLDQWKSQGMPPAMLDAQAQRLATASIQQLAQNRPDLQQALARFAQNPQALTYAGLKTAEQQSKQGQIAIKQRLEEFKTTIEAKRQEETERHNRSMESNTSRRTTLAEQKEDTKKKVSEGELLGDKDVEFMAGQYLSGDKSVMQNLGRGQQGAQNIVRLRKEIRQQAVDAGMTPADVTGKMAEFNALMSEERSIGTIAGKVEFASAELNKFLPLAEAASAGVPRGNFVPMTKLIQLGEKNISDPNLKRLYVNTQGVLNAYDVLAARGGSDKDKREHNRQMLMTADGPEAYKTALDAIKQELDVAKEAGPEAKKHAASELKTPEKDDPSKVVHWDDLK